MGNTFKKKEVDNAALQIWCEELYGRDERGMFVICFPNKNDRRWTVRKHHVMKAINRAKNSAPGPDGIPAAAYKRLGSLAASVIFNAMQALRRSDGMDQLREAYGDRC